jgi:CelD/BcsL family acetyltransferase involved in cellulose biosynthesis
MITVHTYSSWTDLDVTAAEWNALAARSVTREVFLTYDFLRCCTPRRGMMPLIIVARKDKALAGIAPMMVADRSVAGMTLRAVEFLGTPESDYSDFIYSEAEVLDALWRRLRVSVAGADGYYLQQIKDSSPTCGYLARIAQLDARPCAISLSVRLPNGPAPIEAYLKGRGLRPRTLRRIEKEGAVTLDVYDSAASMQANLPVLFDQHTRRWADTPTNSRFNQPGSNEMYMELAASPQLGSILTVLRLNNAPVASLFGFVYQSKLAVYTIAYDPEYQRFHCGLVCIAKTLQAASERGITSVDFTRGNESYKSFFADQPSISFEFIHPVSVKGKLLIPAFLAAKDLVLGHNRLRSIVRRFGLMASGVEPRSIREMQADRARHSASLPVGNIR